jgi:SlyX protein
MPSTPSLTTRLESLESRIAHQDRTIEELNTSVTEQWKQIDALAKEVERMAARLQQVEDNAPGAADPPPPHY